MIRVISFGSLKVWLYIQQIHMYNDEDLKNLPEVREFLCYFKFAEPTIIVLGEIIREDEDVHPKVFRSIEEAEQFSVSYIEKRFHFKK